MQKTNLWSLLWRLIRPEGEEIIVFATAAVILASIAGYNLANNGSLGTDSADIVTSMRGLGHQFTLLLSSGDVWAKILVFGVWFIAGCFMYFLAWFLINLIINAYNDVVVSAAFVHPKAFHQSDFWGSIVGRALVRIAAGIALIFYTIFWVLIFAPLALQAIGGVFLFEDATQVITNLLFFIFIVVTTLHVGIVVSRLLLLRSSTIKP